MNRYLLSAFCALFLPFFCNGQVHKKISLSFNDDDFKFSSTDKELSFVLSRYPVLQSFNESEPNLPYMILHVLVGRDDEYMDVTANYQVMSISKGRKVRSYQSHQSETEKESSTPQANDCYSKASYPDEYVKYAGTSVVDGYKYLTFHICPFQYRTLDKELLFKKQIELDILLGKDSKQSSLLNRGKAMRNVVRHLVVNGDEMDLLYPLTQSKAVGQGDIDYLIITEDSLKEAFQKLVNWKARKGVRCRIEILDSIYSQYHDNLAGAFDGPWRIKQAIAHWKDSFNIAYVLLGGDPTIVPVQLCYGKFIQSQNPNDPNAL